MKSGIREGKESDRYEMEGKDERLKAKQGRKGKISEKGREEKREAEED